jgi:hypothetical protein
MGLCRLKFTLYLGNSRTTKLININTELENMEQDQLRLRFLPTITPTCETVRNNGSETSFILLTLGVTEKTLGTVLLDCGNGNKVYRKLKFTVIDIPYELLPFILLPRSVR